MAKAARKKTVARPRNTVVRYVLAGCGGRGTSMFGVPLSKDFHDKTRLVGLFDWNTKRMAASAKMIGDPGLPLMNPNHAYGIVDDCIGYVGRLLEAGADEILFLCQMGTVPQWAQLETIRNIGEHVIPYFRGSGA